MRRKLLKILLAAVIASCGSSAFSDSPHWDYGEQSTWWAVEDTSQTPPLSFPYAECGVGKHQSPVDLASAKIDVTQLNPLEILYGVDTRFFQYWSCDTSQYIAQIHWCAEDWGGIFPVNPISFS